MGDASVLLHEAESRVSDRLLASARASWRGGFAAGADWMRRAMEECRGERPAGDAHFQRLGAIKYAVCALAAAVPLVAAALSGAWWPLVLIVPAFYAAEAQVVFVFPVALDGSPRPFRAARAMVPRAGGTLGVMATVLPIAARMLAGGFVGRGFLRSWCVGCMAVVLWYERVRGAA